MGEGGYIISLPQNRKSMNVTYMSFIFRSIKTDNRLFRELKIYTFREQESGWVVFFY